MIKIREKGRQDYTLTWEEMISFTNSRTADTPDELWLLEPHAGAQPGMRVT